MRTLPKRKCCCTCRKQRALSRFSRQGASPDGLGKRCKSCVAENYRQNAEQIRQRRKEWYQANREAELKRLQQWRAEQLERSREIVRKSRAGIRSRRRAAGLCTECGAEPKPGYLYCPQCMEREAKRKLLKKARH